MVSRSGHERFDDVIGVYPVNVSFNTHALSGDRFDAFPGPLVISTPDTAGDSSPPFAESCSVIFLHYTYI